MGWFGFGSGSDKPNPVNRLDRQKCWDSRDAYFACLDDAGVLEAGKEGNACTSQNAKYKENCAKSWVRKCK
jgi:cytochrome c oxidase assembly factor 6